MPAWPQPQWVLTGYLVTVASVLLLAGAFADHFGRRRILMTGLVVMLLASLACSVAPTAATLIAARLVQGIGGALVVPSSLALLNGTLTEDDRARGIGIWAGISTLGTALGPYGGGWQVDHASWRYVFLLNIPLVLPALCVLRKVPDTAIRRALSVDVIGGLLAVVGLGGVIYALTEAPHSNWTSARVLAPGLVGIVSLVALVPVEQRRRQPMLRTALFRSRVFDAINVATLIFYGVGGRRLSGRAAVPGAVLWGLGIGLGVAPLTAGVLAAVDDRDLGEAAGINDAASRIGGVVVIALVPVLLGAGRSAGLSAPLAANYQTAMLVMAGLSVAAALITAASSRPGAPFTSSRRPILEYTAAP